MHTFIFSQEIKTFPLDVICTYSLNLLISSQSTNIIFILSFHAIVVIFVNFTFSVLKEKENDAGVIPFKVLNL